MSKITTVLFDFDGVIVDTEKLYDIFWNNIAERERLGIENFASKIKGNTLPDMFEKFMPNHSTEQRRKITQECEEFEKVIRFDQIEGSLNFVAELKNRGYKVGLVTSSGNVKMERAFRELAIESLFDSVVTADRISQGKPHPMCYLLGAKDLEASPEECAVFEDAFSGIQAGTSAGMRVIGLSTTNPSHAIQDKVYGVIPHFGDMDLVFELLA